MKFFLLLLLGLGAGFTAHAATLVETNAPPAKAAPPRSSNWLDDLRVTSPGAGSPSERSPRIFTPPPVEMATNRIQTAVSPGEIPMAKSIYGPVAAEHMLRAQNHLSSNQVYQATRELWLAAREKPHLEDPAAGLAMCMLMAEDYANAAGLLEKLLESFPSSMDLRFNLASAYYGVRRHREALAILGDLAETYPDPGKVQFNLAMNQLALDNPAEAKRHLLSSASIQPSNPFPLLALARLEARENDREAMLLRLREACALLRDEEKNHYLLDPAFAAWQRDPEFLTLFALPEAPEIDSERPLYLTPLAPLPFPR